MDFDKLFNTAKKIWDNGGKEIVEKITSSLEAPAKPQEAHDKPQQAQPEKPQNAVVSVPENASTPKEKKDTTENGIMLVHDNMTSEEDDQFIQSLQNGFCSISAKNPAEAMAALKVFATATKETIKFVKSQEVKREKIVAEKETKIAQISATKEILKEYLDKTFDERKDTFNKYFEVVDAALANGNNEALAKALDEINSLAASSPFKDLSNMSTFKEIMNNSNEDLDI